MDSVHPRDGGARLIESPQSAVDVLQQMVIAVDENKKKE